MDKFFNILAKVLKPVNIILCFIIVIILITQFNSLPKLSILLYAFVLGLNISNFFNDHIIDGYKMIVHAQHELLTDVIGFIDEIINDLTVLEKKANKTPKAKKN